ncbi:MAG TPA: hypothetical protein DCS15_06970 [Flavobacteriales bacterium]|nr:hypothetical protein [Salibacteraceae bacterium]HAS36211.1 hypothetical protein [Flavobacteriales bacterium]
MSIELQNTVFQADLQRLEDLLRDEEVNVKYLNPTELLPTPSLFVEVKSSYEQNRNVFVLNYVKMPERLFEGAKLLQFFAETEVEIDKSKKVQLSNLIHRLNNTIPIGSYFLADTGKLSLRYVHPMPRYDLVDDHIANVMNLLPLLSFVLDAFSPTLMQFNSERISYEEAVAKLP